MRILLSFFFCLAFISAHAQITVTSSVLPAAGDQYFTARDATGLGATVTPASATAQTWDFSAFVPLVGTVQQNDVQDAATGAAIGDFPSADIIVPFLGGDGYVDTDGGTFEALGFNGDIGIGAVFTVPLIPTSTQLVTPLNMNDTYSDSYGFFVSFDPGDIPFLDSLIPAGITVDSARINFSATRNDVVDAHGSLTTHFGTYDVLRQERYEISNTLIEAKVPFIGWIDISLIPGLPAIPFGGLDTTITYEFRDAVHKAPIASIDVDPATNAINSVTYLSDPSLTPVTSAGSIEPVGMSLYPNPVVSNLRLDVPSLDNGEYTVSIFNLIGKQISDQRITMSSGSSNEIDVKELPQGTYLLSLRDDQGAILDTRSFVVLKP